MGSPANMEPLIAVNAAAYLAHNEQLLLLLLLSLLHAHAADS